MVYSEIFSGLQSDMLLLEQLQFSEFICADIFVFLVGERLNVAQDTVLTSPGHVILKG